MSLLKRELLLSALDSLLLTVFFGLLAGMNLAGGNTFQALIFVIVSFLNVSRISVRYNLFKEQPK